MIKVDEIKLNVGFNERDIKIQVAKNLNIFLNDIKKVELIKLAIDARKKPNVFYVANVGVELSAGLEQKFESQKYVLDNSLLSYAPKQTDERPVIVGFGPAGMFCALALARMGLRPIVIEQGKCVEEREIDVNNFWKGKKLNKFSNVQFGEGGAGTFSDGKLNTNLSSKQSMIVAKEFVHYGAPKEILYLSKPHIGSDNLKNIVKNIRQDIISMGGSVLFNTKLINVITNNNVLSEIEVLNTLSGKVEKIKVNKLVLALGHSARDTFRLLYNLGFNIKQKPFAMGVRIEQLQEDINQSQYGKGYDKRLPAADYKLVEHLPNGRSVFTFCMCPGGEVVASASEEGQVVTNGMSYFARNKQNANSALLVNVNPSDYESDHPLAGVEFQAKYERMAFDLGGKNYNAPCESVKSFLNDSADFTGITPSYKPNVTFAKIKKCLPSFVYESLKCALPKLNKKLNNFAKDENMLTAIESRSSCPLTILRDENFESNIKGVYPAGEGAGYAGGIVSSAIDGIKVAEKIYESI